MGTPPSAALKQILTPKWARSAEEGVRNSRGEDGRPKARKKKDGRGWRNGGWPCMGSIFHPNCWAIDGGGDERGGGPPIKKIPQVSALQ